MSKHPSSQDKHPEKTLSTVLPETEAQPPPPPSGSTVPIADANLSSDPMPDRPKATELQPGQVIGKCEIVRELGRGGMGAVYLARHKTLDVPVAVKILPPEIAGRDPQFAERFMREAKLACRIKHANVIAVMDADQDQKTGLYMIVQEFIDGGTARDLTRKGPVPEAQALDIAAGVAEALVAAADFGIIHRDIKPDNIMLTGKGVVKLADLGIAKEVTDEEAGLTMSHVMMGTPAYMAPEQANDAKTVDVRADIYSLGATLYHMLCGTAPFDGDTAYAVLTKLATEPTPDPREKVPEISAETAELVMRMMDKDREKRPQSATQLLDEINALRKPNAAASDLQKTAQSLINEMRAMRDAAKAGGGTAVMPAANETPGQAGSHRKAILAAAAILAALLVIGALQLLWRQPESPSASGAGQQIEPDPATTAAIQTPPAETTLTDATADPADSPQPPSAIDREPSIPSAAPDTTGGPGTAGPAVPATPALDLAALRESVDGMLRKALDEEVLANPDVRSLFDNPVRFVNAETRNIDPALVVRELVEKRVKIQDVFAILGKPRVGIDIVETVVGKDGLTARDSRIDRFRTALRNEMEAKYGLFIVDVTGDRERQKTQCDILISGNVETIYFGEAVPPELAELGGNTPLISYNTAVKVRFLNAVTNQDIDSSVMDFEPRGREQYCGMSNGDAIRNSVKGAIENILPDWMEKVETTWVKLRTTGNIEEIAVAQ